MKALKGLVLAAGFGQRLRPLTDRFPKPLIPFLGSTPLSMAINRLNAAGVGEIAVNGHYLREKIAAYLDTHHTGVHFSPETEILGTGGVYNQIRPWLGESHLLVLNGDVVADIDLKRLIDTHFQTDALATMAMLPDVVPGENGFECVGNRVIEFATDGRSGLRNFACAQILSPKILDSLPKQGSFGIIEKGYLPALHKRNVISCSIHNGIWHDIRDPGFYKMALNDVLSNKDNWNQLGLLTPPEEYTPVSTNFVHTSAIVGESVTLGEHNIIDRQVELSGCGILSNGLVMPETGLLVDGDMSHFIRNGSDHIQIPV